MYTVFNIKHLDVRLSGSSFRTRRSPPRGASRCVVRQLGGGIGEYLLFVPVAGTIQYKYHVEDEHAADQRRILSLLRDAGICPGSQLQTCLGNSRVPPFRLAKYNGPGESVGIASSARDTRLDCS